MNILRAGQEKVMATSCETRHAAVRVAKVASSVLCGHFKTRIKEGTSFLSPSVQHTEGKLFNIVFRVCLDKSQL